MLVVESFKGLVRFFVVDSFRILDRLIKTQTKLEAHPGDMAYLHVVSMDSLNSSYDDQPLHKLGEHNGHMIHVPLYFVSSYCLCDPNITVVDRL